MTLIWKRTDVEGLERLELTIGDSGVTATSTVLCVDDGGFRLDHAWQLDPGWRALSVHVERWGVDGHKTLLLERGGHGRWRVDGVARPDLDGAEEADLSVTPFCNTFPIRRTAESLTLDTAFIDGAAMSVARSKQRYDRFGPNRLRYLDLGLSKDFQADLVVDDLGLVIRYEHLFERVSY